MSRSSFEHFQQELRRLCQKFGESRSHFRADRYDESSLRIEYLDVFWTALGWDLRNRENRPQALREVQVEPPVHIEGKMKRADYIFRTDGLERLVCEAKKPQDDLNDRHAYQVQRYAY